MNKTKSETELRIFEAAKKIFQKHGFDGARMQDIANEAGINKAMLHYYFRSKEKIFEVVFEDAFKDFYVSIFECFISDDTVEAKITNFIEVYMDVCMKHPYIPSFVMHELQSSPERHKAMFLKNIDKNSNSYSKKFREELKEKTKNKISPEQFIVNLMSMTVFPFIAKPLIIRSFNFSEEDYFQFLQERKKILPQIIIDSLNE